MGSLVTRFPGRLQVFMCSDTKLQRAIFLPSNKEALGRARDATPDKAVPLLYGSNYNETPMFMLQGPQMATCCGFTITKHCKCFIIRTPLRIVSDKIRRRHFLFSLRSIYLTP